MNIKLLNIINCLFCFDDTPLLKKIILGTAVLIFAGNLTLTAQVLSDSVSIQYVHIDSITFAGNRKTRARILLRELEFRVGDSIPMATLAATIERNRLRLLNLGLFNEAKMNVRNMSPDGHATIHIQLTETWVLYPIPLFELADRNFNVWWDEFNHSLRRVNYGIDLTHLNLTGYADQLKFKIQAGFNHKYEVAYKLPPLNKAQTLVLNGSASYSRSRDVAYKTEGNKLLFRRDDDVWQIRQISASVRLTWRPQLLTSHTFNLEYRNNRVADTIATTINPNFFLNSAVSQRHTNLIYGMSTDHRDFQAYPSKGWHVNVEVRLNGLLPGDDLRLARFYGQYARYFPIKKHSSFELIAAGRVSLPRKKPPFFNNQALGYGSSLVRGYQYYVSDGLDFALVKTSLRIQVFNKTINFGKYMPFKAFRSMPFRVMLLASNDFGISNDPYYTATNPLVNTLLWGYGPGIDLIAFYNKTFRVEWIRNRLGESGYFITVNTGI